MTFNEILKDLKNKIYKPIYFLMGDEAYYIDVITKYISDNVLTDAEKSFNQTVLYGKDTDISTVINASKRFPMMANYQVVIVREAQNIKKIDDLIHYANNPLKSTILVINYKYKTLDKRKKIYTALRKNSVIFESKKIYDDKIPDWIMNYLKDKNISIDPNATMLLSEYLGNDLNKIVNELDKLIITLDNDSSKITVNDIEQNIGISKEYNNFELTKALSKKDVLKANRIVNFFSHNPNSYPLVLTITSLYFYFSKVLMLFAIKDKSDNNMVASTLKVHPFFVNDYKLAAKNYGGAKAVEIISLLREYDLKSKGVDSAYTEPGELLKELVYKILH